MSMKNLRDQLADVAGSPAEPTTAQIDADLARGQKALRRRRLAQSAAGSAFAVAAVAAAFTFATAGSPAPTAPEAKAPATSATAPAAFQLVDYKGKQPDAFTVDKVPAGWEVQGVTEGSLTVGPIGMADKDPNSFEGKVAVMLQSVDEDPNRPGTEVKVGDKDGVFVKMLDAGDGSNLLVRQPNGINLQIQVWDGIGWSHEQIVEFAKGVHVNPNAKQGRG
jgi:hypothetical protein